MKQFVTTISVAIFAGAWSVFAQEPAPAPATPAVPAQVTAPAAPATPTAAAQQEPFMRDPFWPIGYTETPVEHHVPDSRTNNVAVPPPPSDVWPKPVIKALTRRGSNVWLTVEGGATYATGETVSVRKGNYIYRWKIDGISEQGVKMSKVDMLPAPRK